jgi:sporulation protein YlmC with PRC-barrel domain
MELKHPDDALSTLLGARVVAADGTALGRVRDVLAHDFADGPVVTALVLRAGRWRRRSVELPWSAIVGLEDGRLIAAPPRHVDL